MDLIKATGQANLPTNPTASDTADWYRLGDAVEKHGRHMKRQAVAAEYNSGREMKSWFALIEQPEQTMRSLLQEAHNLGLTSATALPASSELSQALPTRHAAREYAKAEPEVKERIKADIEKDPEIKISAARIQEIRLEEREKLQKEFNEQQKNLINDALAGRKIVAENIELRDQLNALTNHEAAELQEARRQLELFNQSLMAFARDIDSISSSTLTYNDPSHIERTREYFGAVIEAFNRKFHQFAEPRKNGGTDSGAIHVGSNYAIIDV